MPEIIVNEVSSFNDTSESLPNLWIYSDKGAESKDVCNDEQSPESDFNKSEEVFLVHKHDHQEFLKLVQSRIEYLEKLKSIGDGWASGKSVAPSVLSIEISKFILMNLYLIVTPSDKLKYFAPSIVLGPIAIGGMSLVIITSETKRLHINIFNDSAMEMDMELNGYFKEIDVDYDSLISRLSESFHQIGIRYDYTGWRNSIQIR